MSRFNPENLDSIESESAETTTLAACLWGALVEVERSLFRLALVRSAFNSAEDAARREGRPSRDLDMLGAEIDILKDLLYEKARRVVQPIGFHISIRSKQQRELGGNAARWGA